MEVCGKELRINGKLIRMGFIDGEGYQFLEDPGLAIKSLQTSGPRIDIFTFIQRLSEASTKLNYPMELDNMAALRVSTFDEWMTQAD